MSFHERYSEEEREALAAALTDRGLRPARRVVELAAAGELEWNGQRLEPFTTTESGAQPRRRAPAATGGPGDVGAVVGAAR